MITPGSSATSAIDYIIISNAMNATADDAAAAADQTGGIARSNALLTGICGTVTVDTTNGQTINITYDSTIFCEGVMRYGNVHVTLTNSTGWRMKGGLITTYVDLTITDPVTTEQLSLTGSFTVANESGGVLSDLANSTGPIIRRQVSFANIQVTYPNGTSFSLSFDRTRSWTNLTTDSATIYGVTEYTEAAGGIECSGTNRFEEAFYNKLDTSMLSDTYKCPSALSPSLQPYRGQVSQYLNGYRTIILYGTNSQGVHIGTPQSCVAQQNYGYYVNYSQSNVTGYQFWPYYF